MIDISCAQVVEVEPNLLVVARALADETRLCILGALRDRGELSCGELVEACSVAQSTVSHHLKTLTDCALLEVREQGQRNLYRIRSLAAGNVLAQVTALLGPRPPARPDPARGLPDLGPGIID